ncbi:hypothetical protein ACHAXM_006403 [Skeletonema potamos]
MASDDTANTNNTIKIDPLTERLREQKRDKLLRRLIPFLLTIPYLLGLIWTALHPIVSIITGELKCRGSYIDENGLDVHRHQVESYPLMRVLGRQTMLSQQRDDDLNYSDLGMCDAIHSHAISSVECLRHEATDEVVFDIARIMPSLGPMIDSAEAVVIVVGEQQQQPAGCQKKGWYESSDLNASILHMIKKLGSSKDAPWLTKIVYIVSPTVNHVRNRVDNATDTSSSSSTSCRQHTNLTTIVDKFIASYIGGGGGSKHVNPLPPEYSFPMMRSLLVISDVVKEEQQQQQQQMSKQGSTQVRILPQGTGGTLPNLDLVFATFYAFQTHPSGGRYDQSHSIYYGNSEFRAHPFGKELENRVVDVFTRLGGILELGTSSLASLQSYASDLSGWIGFVAALVIGPVQPHSFALNHGVDALTIEVHVPTTTSDGVTSNPAIHPHYADLSRCIEHLLRSISNLHERLHHSIAQYTMPSPSKFVSHGEYIYPAILVALPMVVRAASLALRDITSFQFVFVGTVVGTVLLASCVNACMIFTTGRSSIGVLMIIVAWVVRRSIPQPCKEKKTTADFDATNECRKSLRFVTCLIGIYLHAPLLLANYSLGFPSAVFWTPLLAILVLSDRLYSTLSKNVVLKTIMTVAKILLLVAISPSTILPSNISPQYVLILYSPLQLLLAALWFV